MYKQLKNIYIEKTDERTIVLHKCFEVEGYLPVKNFTNKPIEFEIEVLEKAYRDIVLYDGFKYFVDEKVNCENWDTVYYLVREDEFFDNIYNVILLHSYTDDEYYIWTTYTTEETEVLTA